MSVIMHNGLPPSICLVCCQSFSFLSQVTSSDQFTKNEAGNQKLIQDLVWFEEPQRKIPKALSQKIFFAKSPSRLCPSRRQALLHRLGAMIIGARIIRSRILGSRTATTRNRVALRVSFLTSKTFLRQNIYL